jgi:hypothetical protein
MDTQLRKLFKLSTVCFFSLQRAVFLIYFVDTINERRLNQVGRKPIKTEEFIVELAALVPIFAEQEDAFTQWFEKTPIGMASFL